MINFGQRAYHHIRRLAGDIGCRMIATPAYLEAADYILQTLKSSGIATCVQELDFPYWKEGGCRLELNGEPLEAMTNAFSSSCNVTAAIVPVGTLQELETAEIQGRTPLLYGHLTRQPLTTKDAFFAGEDEHRVYKILEEKQPAAVITIHPAAHNLWPLIEDWQLNLASVTVSSRTGRRLLKAAGQTVHLEIQTHTQPGKARNLIGGSGEKDGRIVLCAHYDTKVNTPGALDNAGGVAALLALAEKWAEKNAVPPQVELVFYGGEEYSMAVDQAYIAQFKNPSRDIRAAINLDGIGHVLKTTTLANFELSPELQQVTSRILQEFPAIQPVDPWPESDHTWFSMQGIPTWAVSQEGLLNLDFAHTPDDNLEWITAEKLAEAVDLTDRLVQSLI